jgi:hypothetical protein
VSAFTSPLAEWFIWNIWNTERDIGFEQRHICETNFVYGKRKYTKIERSVYTCNYEIMNLRNNVYI